MKIYIFIYLFLCLSIQKEASSHRGQISSIQRKNETIILIVCHLDPIKLARPDLGSETK